MYVFLAFSRSLITLKSLSKLGLNLDYRSTLLYTCIFFLLLAGPHVYIFLALSRSLNKLLAGLFYCCSFNPLRKFRAHLKTLYSSDLRRGIITENPVRVRALKTFGILRYEPQHKREFRQRETSQNVLRELSLILISRGYVIK